MGRTRSLIDVEMRESSPDNVVVDTTLMYYSVSVEDN